MWLDRFLDDDQDDGERGRDEKDADHAVLVHEVDHGLGPILWISSGQSLHTKLSKGHALSYKSATARVFVKFNAKRVCKQTPNRRKFVQSGPAS
jgi:hypothetical protein